MNYILNVILHEMYCQFRVLKPVCPSGRVMRRVVVKRRPNFTFRQEWSFLLMLAKTTLFLATASVKSGNIDFLQHEYRIEASEVFRRIWFQTWNEFTLITGWDGSLFFASNVKCDMPGPNSNYPPDEANLVEVQQKNWWDKGPQNPLVIPQDEYCSIRNGPRNPHIFSAREVKYVLKQYKP